MIACANPVATTLYALSVPAGRRQTIVYDDGTGDKLDVPLGTTAFVSGTNMFDILSPEYKSLAVRSKVQYMPHPYVAISDARAMSTGLGIESEGRETPKEKLPAWTESQIQTLPMTWKNPVTGLLHFQVHPCGVEKIIVDPLPADYQGDRSKALYPDGTTISDLKEARELLYKLQRPAIAPKYVYAHDWKQGDLCLFHNRGVRSDFLHDIRHTLTVSIGPAHCMWALPPRRGTSLLAGASCYAFIQVRSY